MVYSIMVKNANLISAWNNVVTALLLFFFIMLQAVFARLKDRTK